MSFSHHKANVFYVDFRYCRPPGVIPQCQKRTGRVKALEDAGPCEGESYSFGRTIFCCFWYFPFLSAYEI